MINDNANGIRAIKENAKKPNIKIVNGVKKYTIPRMSKKMIEKKLDESGRFKENAELEKWFLERRKEMTGLCSECGKRTFKDDNKQYKWSLAHLLPKSIFASVATNEFNFLELCFLHHQEFDSSWDKAKQMMCWGLAKRKVSMFIEQVTETHKILEHYK
jgi:molecular chaperone DnaK (HSP70)